MKKHLMILIVPIFALLAACSSGPPPAEFTIEMSEFAFSPNTIEVQVGQEVTLHLVNTGALAHELMIGREVVMNNNMAETYAHNLFEGHGPHVEGAEDDHSADMPDDHGFMVLMPAGSDEATVTFTVTEEMVGTWEIGCFTDGGSHYGQGMRGTFVVTP